MSGEASSFLRESKKKESAEDAVGVARVCEKSNEHEALASATDKKAAAMIAARQRQEAAMSAARQRQAAAVSAVHQRQATALSAARQELEKVEKKQAKASTSTPQAVDACNSPTSGKKKSSVQTPAVPAQAALLLLDVCPLSINVDLGCGIATTVIPRNTTIPCKKTVRIQMLEGAPAPTFTGDSSLTVTVSEGQRFATADNLFLGQFELQVLLVRVHKPRPPFPL